MHFLFYILLPTQICWITFFLFLEFTTTSHLIDYYFTIFLFLVISPWDFDDDLERFWYHSNNWYTHELFLVYLIHLLVRIELQMSQLTNFINIIIWIRESFYEHKYHDWCVTSNFYTLRSIVFCVWKFWIAVYFWSTERIFL